MPSTVCYLCGMEWSWLSFFIGYMGGAVSLFMLLGLMQIGASNDEIQPSIPETKPDRKQRLN